MKKIIFTIILMINSLLLSSCDLSSLQLDNYTFLGNNEWQIDMTLCVASGSALANTGNFLFIVSGSNVLMAPSTITSPQTGAVYSGVITGGNVEYTNFSDWFTTTPGQPNSNCVSVTFITEGYPLQVQVYGLEGADSYTAGCIEGFILPPLPINLSSFDVQIDGCYNEIKWTTHTEINSGYFDIEYSTDGYNFDIIGSVTAMGDSYKEMEYTFTDKIPRIGYYRLKMIDKDMTFTYSNIKYVKNECDLSNNIFPNPSNGVINYLYQGDIVSNCVVKIYDIKGNLLLTEFKLVNPLTPVLSFDVRGFNRGTYVFTIQVNSVLKAHWITLQ